MEEMNRAGKLENKYIKTWKHKNNHENLNSKGEEQDMWGGALEGVQWVCGKRSVIRTQAAKRLMQCSCVADFLWINEGGKS